MRPAVTEDTPPDMLAGQMGLRLKLPTGNHVRMSVSRSTPMMDLLVQVTTAHKLSPAGHILQPYGESGLLPYKPSTPIGALDTWTVHVVPKLQGSHNSSSGKSSKQSVQPFEQTYRIQVHLPRKQLYVTRVSGRTTLGQVLKQVCNEKNLDPSKYSFRHPRQLDQALSEDLSIGDFRHNQLCLVSNKALPSPVSSEDILAMQQYYPSRESSSRSLSPDSSVSPQPPQPSRPIRKRRPAPKPPAQPQPSNKNEGNSTVISHSRTSSDSSGYHEASVLSESPDSNNSLPDSLPRRSKLPGREGEISRSLGDLNPPPVPLKASQSTSALPQGRKKKPAPAPPVPKMTSVAEEAKTMTPISSSESDTTVAPSEVSSVVEKAELIINESPTVTDMADSREEETKGEEAKPAAEAEEEGVVPPEEKATEVVRKAPLPRPRSGQPSIKPRPEIPVGQPKEEEQVVQVDTKPELGQDKKTEESQIPTDQKEGPSSPPSEEIVKEEEQEEMAGDVRDGCPPEVLTKGHRLETDLKRYVLGEEPEIRSVESTGDLARLAMSLEASLHHKWPSCDNLADDSELTMADEEIDRIFNNATGDHSSEGEDGGPVVAPLPSPPPPAPPDPLDWEYRLPAPPTFRDEPVERGALLKELREAVGKKPLAAASPSPEQTVWSQETCCLSNFTIGTYQGGLRKTTSELNISAASSAQAVSSSPPPRKRLSPPQSPHSLENEDTPLEKKELNKKRVEFEKSVTGLQSLSVLRSILPHLSQSQGSINKLGMNPPAPITTESRVVRGPQRPAVSVTTWGERPKRQVSIKSDKDYVFGKGQAQPRAQPPVLRRADSLNREPKTSQRPSSPTTNKPEPKFVEELNKSVSVKERLRNLQNESSPTDSNAPGTVLSNGPKVNGEVRLFINRKVDVVRSRSSVQEDPKKRESSREVEEGSLANGRKEQNPGKAASSRGRSEERRSHSIYKELETGNTRPIRLREVNDVSRVPIVRSVELKKPQPKSTYLFGDTPVRQPQIKKFTSVVGISGPESQVISVSSPPPPPPMAKAPAVPKIKQPRFTRQADPREELLESIRAFGGRANLRKVSSR